MQTKGGRGPTLHTHFLLMVGNFSPFQIPPAAWKIKDTVGSKDFPLPLKYLEAQGVP